MSVYMVSNSSQLRRVAARFAFIALVVLPVVYQVRGVQGLWRGISGAILGVVIGFLTTVKSERTVALDVSFIFGLAGGFLGGLLAGVPRGSLSAAPVLILILPIYLVFGIIVGLHGPLANMFYSPGPGQKRFNESWWGATIMLIYIFVLPIGTQIYIYYQGYGRTFDDSVAFGTSSGFFLVAVGVGLGKVIGVWTGPIIRALDQVMQYLRSMGPPIVAFIVGYLFISFIFAGLYGAVWRAYRQSFSGLPTSPTVGDFYYYSVVTIRRSETGSFAPSLDWRDLWSASRSPLGLVGLPVVLAAVIELLQHQFGRNGRGAGVPAPDSLDRHR
jgi:hypothetical protein